MEKYVAFLDILGFKDSLKRLSQSKAKEYICNFSKTIYNTWQKKSYMNVKGYIVSDSVIIYTIDVSGESLKNLICLLSEICKKEFKENRILIRGGLAKGNFDKVDSHDLETLSKGLIVGQAYVDAYLLESSEKNIGIVISGEVYKDVINLDFVSKRNIVVDKSNGKENYILRFIDANFLSDYNNLKSFILMAKESKWLPHYYNTLYCSMINETNNNYIESIFDNIINILCDNYNEKNWIYVDEFIENAFNENVSAKFKKRLLRYIRRTLLN